MKKLAILGASYLQRPLVEKAKQMGLETHVFAWEKGNVVDDIADFFYPISVIEKENILKKCRSIGIDGITSIASDIVMTTVNYVADKLSLVGNSLTATRISTDKFEMRKALKNADISCPAFSFYQKPDFCNTDSLTFPLIVKPTDRSGSRGVTKVENPKEVNAAIEKALDNSINKRVIVEEFIEGREFSVEMISYQGNHHFLAVTDKVTTGDPYFVEIEHHQPAEIGSKTQQNIIQTVKHALDVLKIKNGASHSEVLLTPEGVVKIVEIAGRMGGDFIGSDMIPLSTGYDFVKGIIQIALGEFESINKGEFKKDFSGVYYVLPKPGTIKSIVDRSGEYRSVRKAINILKKGDKIPDVIDGPGKRAGVIVYSHPGKKININPNEVLQFKTS
ncbi:MAG TPA: ATP-grasp domain-containing protein [Bacteroidales bacterium]|nr:ATP-grasp domain-containing protein [Bacteroidales bacterium]